MEKPGAEWGDFGPSKKTRPKRILMKHEDWKNDSQDLVKDSGDDLKVPDGGWGWLVAFGSLIICMLILMINPCFGVLFSRFLLEMGTSSATTAWIFNTQSFTLYMMGLFVSPLTKEFGWRKIGIFGCMMASASIILSAFAPFAEFLFFSFSFLSGVGGGLSVCMCFIIVPIYFDRRRGMANAILMAGVCMGEVGGPPLIRYLQDEYTFKGATLILGAILLNGCVGACFFHPVEWHMKKPSTKVEPETHGANLPLIREGEAEMEVSGAGIISKKPARSSYKTPSGLSLEIRKTYSGVSLSNSNVGQELETGASFAKIVRVRGLRHLSECSHDSNPSFFNSTLSVSSLALFGHTTLTSCRERDVKVDMKDEHGGSAVKESLVRVLRSTVSDLKILRYQRAIIISIAGALFASGYLNFIMMLPFAMQAADHTLQDSALCLSVAAICNLVSRLLMSLMSDCPWFNLRAAYLCGYVVLTSAMVVFPFLSDQSWMLATMGLLGCGVGTSMSLNTLFMIDIMGLGNLPPVFAVSSLVVGLGFITSGPLIGLIRDVSGSYVTSMLICSALTFSSFLLWLCMPLAAAWDKRQDRKSEEKAREKERHNTTSEDQDEV